MKNRLEPGEFVQGLRVPLPQPGWQVRAYKISKRFDCDISAVCAALAIKLDETGDVVAGVRLVFGGMAAIVRHADRAEAAVLGKPWTQASVHAAMQALGEDFNPLTDMRASAEYRLQVARNLLQRRPPACQRIERVERDAARDFRRSSRMSRERGAPRSGDRSERMRLGTDQPILDSAHSTGGAG
jgi:xanthine dehydrogenase iron-sulfur cluster and FAD-binding subunit A